MFRNPALVTAALAVVILAPAAAPAQYDGLDMAFRERAPAIIEFAKKQGYKNVGVLKFLVARGDAEPTDNFGELNMGLADRLELALILANPNEQLGIIQRTSTQIITHSYTFANHRDQDGRKAFFYGPYELAWGSDKVEASAFITGTARLSKDLASITIKLQIFGKDGELADLPGGTITAAATSRILSGAGSSFYLKPAVYQKALEGARGQPKELRDVQLVAERIEQHKAYLDKVQKQPNEPAVIPALAEGPVQLTVLINGTRREITDGRIPEPKAGDEFAFELFNRSQGICAVVLKINGESTIGRERGDPWFNKKWVLAPSEKVKIEGFFVEGDQKEEFEILPQKESDALAVRYGDNAGTIRMTVWQGVVADEKKDPDRESALTDTDLSLMAIARGSVLAEVKPQNLQALKEYLVRSDRVQDGARGLVVAGKKKGGGETQTVHFKAESSIPVAEAVVQYYDPRKTASGPKVSK